MSLHNIQVMIFLLQITCLDEGDSKWYTSVKQTACMKKYCECDKIMVDAVYYEMSVNDVNCPTEDSKCAKRGRP